MAESRAARRAPRAFAAVNLQADIAAVRITLAGVGKIDGLDFIQPCLNVCGLAGDARAQMVPAFLAISFLPVGILKQKAAFSRGIEAADETAVAVINRHLITHAVIA